MSCHLWLPRPTLSISLYVKGCLYCTIGVFHIVHTSGAFSPSEWGPDPQCQAVQVAHRSWWWQYLAAWHCRSVWSFVVSFRCRRWRFGFVYGQVSQAWSIVLRTQELYTWPHVLKERWQEERTGSRSLNFFQAVFRHFGVESSLTPAAESMSPW